MHKLALRGSSKVVNEFFEYCINTILFQRGVYPAEDFTACVLSILASTPLYRANPFQRQKVWFDHDGDGR